MKIINDMFFEMGLDGSTSLANVGFSMWAENLVNTLEMRGLDLSLMLSNNCFRVL
jgi:hypothetical protein